MSQHDYVIANGTGAAVRSDLNNALAAIVSQNSGATAPATTYAYMPWADTTAGLFKIRNAANNAWITLYQLDGEWSTLAIENGSASAPSIYFKDSGTDTGIYSPGTDQVAISTGGTVRLSLSTTAVSSALAIDHPLGAVGTPSITFTGDLNTGLWSPAADTVALSTGGTERIRVTSTGAVGIGTTTPSNRLTVTQTAGGVMANFTNGADADFNIGCTSGVTTIGPEFGVLALKSVNTERARIDSSGRLLVGTSSSRSVGLGSGFPALFQVETTNFVAATLVNNSNDIQPAYLNLGKSRGGIGGNTIVQNNDFLGQLGFAGADGTDLETLAATITCQVDGTPGANDMPGRLVFSVTPDGSASPVEAMRLENNGSMRVSGTIYRSGSCGLRFSDANLIPQGSTGGNSDNAVNLGNGTNRWAVVYAGTGTINTSDFNLKQDIQELEQSELNVASAIKGLIKKFRFTDAVAAKGNDARIHVGVIAQEVEQAFATEGLDPRRYGMFCEDTLEDGSKRLGIRYDELLAFVIAAL